jgi:hypothetical protein
MPAGLTQQEYGGDDDRHRQPPVHLLAVFEQVHLAVRNPELGLTGVKRKVLTVRKFDSPGGSGIQF